VRRAAAFAFVLGVALAAWASPAQASFPGASGKFIYTLYDPADGDVSIYVVNPDGSGLSRVTNPPTGEQDALPVFSADGQRVAFLRYVRPSGQYDAFVVNVNGTGLTQLTHTQEEEYSISWSPDGTRLVVRRLSELVLMNDDGTGVTTLVSPPPDSQYDIPKWSPDGTKIAFRGYPVSTGLGDIYTVNTDGTGFTNVTQTPSVFEPSFDWSPDGMRLVYRTRIGDQAFYVINRDGTGKTSLGPAPNTNDPIFWSPDGTRILFDAVNPSDGLYTMRPDGTQKFWFAEGPTNDWQPAASLAPAGPARAKTASPTFVPLVPAYRNCTAPNRAHGGGLAYQSCSNPTRASQYLTVGTPDSNQLPVNSTGFVRYTAVIGDPNTAASEADLRLEAQVTDVRGASTLADYLAELRVTATVRLTQRVRPSQTVVDFPFNWSVGCSATADPNIGSTCATVTSANAVIPGTVVERDRASWELSQIQVQDGGDDGVGSTESDNTVFMRQGIFVP
jgi:TolB protein